jgi:hypothetical protein
MRKRRNTETDEQRNERSKENARRLSKAGIASDDAIDELVKRSIEMHGP